MIIYEDVLRAFQKHNVKYILVGGLAFNLQGAFRSTEDLDVLVEMTDVNLAKVVKILKQKNITLSNRWIRWGLPIRSSARIGSRIKI